MRAMKSIIFLVIFCVFTVAAWSDSTVPSVENMFQMSLVNSIAADSSQPFADGQSHTAKDTSAHYHTNLVELFLGGTYEDGDHGSEDGFSVGIVYERRLNNLWGTGGFYEYVAGDFDKWSVGIPLFIHPYKEFRFTLAPGLEHRDSGDEFLFRLGVGYEFELSKRWIWMPEFNVDFVDGQEAYVFGLAIGYGF